MTDILDLTPLQEDKTFSIKIGDKTLDVKIRDLYEQSKKPDVDIEQDLKGFMEALTPYYSELLGEEVNAWQTEVLFNYSINYVEQLFKKK